jgi:putative flavoprotein involved in K+ transport
VLDDGRYRAALATGNPDALPMFSRLDEHQVVWADESGEHIDAVILATGYRPNLAYLDGTGALGASGQPLHRAGVSSSLPGLGYVGLDYQRSIASATVRGVGRDAQRVMKRLVAQHADAPAARRHHLARVLRVRCCAGWAR